MVNGLSFNTLIQYIFDLLNTRYLLETRFSTHIACRKSSRLIYQNFGIVTTSDDSALFSHNSWVIKRRYHYSCGQDVRYLGSNVIILHTNCEVREQTILERKIFIRSHICIVDNNSLFCHNLDLSYAMVTIFALNDHLPQTHHDY